MTVSISNSLSNSTACWEGRSCFYMDTAAVQAFRLLRTAAGMFEFVRDHCAPFLINAVASQDCSVLVRLSAVSSSLQLLSPSPFACLGSPESAHSWSLQ